MHTGVASRSKLIVLMIFLWLPVADSAPLCSRLTLAKEGAFEIPATNDGLPGVGPIRRYDWFRDLWRNRRSQWAKEVTQNQGAVVFLGDSITQGWGSRMGDSFPGMKVANRGISGDTTRGMLIRLSEDVLSLRPAAIVMLMGTNDLEEGAEPATIAANLRSILAALRSHNSTMPIVLCNVFPSSATKKRPKAAIQEINKLYGEIVKGDPQITVVDTWSLFADESGDAKKAEFPDLLHPNKAGYAKWGAALRPIFATLGFLERDFDSFNLEPGYVELFNGEDLDGWMVRPSTEEDKKQSANWRKNDPNAPPWPIVETPKNYDDHVATDDGRYVAKNGRLIVTTPPEGRKIQQFWTQREFPQDFVLKLEFRATPNADSGIFLRGRQLQCRDYLLAGPYKELKKYRPQDWNEIVVSVKGQSAFCTCNGEVLEADFRIPATGPIGLEGDRGQIEYRRIRFKEVTAELPRSIPEEQGISSAALLKFVDALEQIDTVHSFMLLRHGAVVAEGWWSPFAKSDPHMLFSLSKSFTSTAVGLAIAEGKLSLDDKVISYFPDDQPVEVSNQLSQLRVRDLLCMSTGHVAADLQKFSFTSSDVLTREFLALPVQHTPGTHFLYNTPATYMLSAIVQKVSGEVLLDYLAPRLFEPLGISGATWSESPQGIAHGGYGLNLRTEDIARFGQMILQQGEWNGRQIVPEEWVQMATSRQTSNGSNPNNDWNQGYGFQFWRCRYNCFRGDGAFGQFCIVMPDQDAVLAVTSGAQDMGAIMRQSWMHLLPAMNDASTSQTDANQTETNRALSKRLQELVLPLVEGAVLSNGKPEYEQRYRMAENDLGIQSMQLDFSGDATLIVDDEAGRISIPLGTDGWQRSRIARVGKLAERVPNAKDVAVASHAAWTDEQTLHVRLWLYESPYRIDMIVQYDKDEMQLDLERNVGFGQKSFHLKGAVLRP